MALLGVLLLMVTLSMLAAALVSVHRGHWALARGQDQRIAAHQACLSAIEYARDRLQSEPSWGTTPFGASSLRLQIPNQLHALEQGSSLANNRLELDLPADDCSATLQVANNLTNTDPLSSHQALQPAFPTWRQLRVPPGSALLVVIGRNARQTRRVEVLLRRRPPLDGALYSGDDLAMIPSAGGNDPVRCDFDGEDASKNKLRARGKLYLPQEARFLRRGAATGRGDVRVGASITVNANGNFPDPTDGTSLVDSPDQQGTLEQQLGGHLNVGPVPQLHLNVSDLESSAGSVHPLPPGKYTFIGPGRVEFQPSTGGPGVVYQDAIYDGGATSGSPSQLLAALSGRKFMLQGQVESNGPLELDSQGGVSRAELALGYSPLSAALDEPGKRTSLRLRGDLKVRGHVVGQGSVAALKDGALGGNVTISGRSTLSSAAGTGLALFSEGDLHMRPAEESGDVTLAADFEALKIGVTNGGGLPTSLRDDFDAFERLSDSDPDGPLPLAGRDALIGLDESRMPGPATVKVRDAIIPVADYQTQVQPLIPNWPARTPSGLYDVPAEALEFVDHCLAPGATGDFEGGMTVGRHSRLMAYLRSVDEGSPEPGWLIQLPANAAPNPNKKYNQLNAGNLKNLLQRLSQDARLEGYSNLDWLTHAGNYYQQKDKRDIDWRGLVYAKGRLWTRGNKQIDVVGALGTETGSLLFDGFTRSKVKFHHSELNSIFRESSLRLEGHNWYLD